MPVGFLSSPSIVRTGYKLAESNTRFPDGGGGIVAPNNRVIIRKPLEIAGTPDRIRVRPLIGRRQGILADVPVGNDNEILALYLTCASGSKLVTWGGLTTTMIIDGTLTTVSDWVTPADLGLSTIQESSNIFIEVLLRPEQIKSFKEDLEKLKKSYMKMN